MIFDEEAFDLVAFSQGEAVAQADGGYSFAFPFVYVEPEVKTEDEWLIVQPSLL